MKIHIVKQGDTLYLIAKKYNVSLEDVINANPEISDPNAIDLGMKVKVPSQQKTAIEVIHHHIVQQGDSLWKLSKSWGIQLVDLIKVNPQLKNPNALLTGEVVNIPKPLSGAVTPGVMIHDNSKPGKANTGLKPATGLKVETGIKPNTGIPMPLPTPLPMPLPTPITPTLPIVSPAHILPIAENQHMDLFKQYPVPSLQAEMPFFPDTFPHDYGMQQPLVSPEFAGIGKGYGYPQSISPVGENIAGNVGGMYGYHENDYIGYGVNNPPYSPTYTSPYSTANYPTNVKGMTSPLGNMPGCNCGGASYPSGTLSPYGISPYSMAPYGNMPQSVSPYGKMPQAVSPYENMPQAVSPYENMPQQISPYENMPQQISPYQNMPQQISPYENMPQQVSPYGNMPQQISPYENMPQQVSPYENMPQQISPYQNMPQQISPYENMPQQISPYENMPQQISPYQNMPQQISPYGKMPQQISPYGKMPQQVSPYENMPQQISPYENMPQQISPYENMPQQISPYENMPQSVSPYGGYPGMYGGYPSMHYGGYPSMQPAGAPMAVSPAAGQFVPGINQPYPYHGGRPSIPAMPPMPPLFPQEVEYDDRSSSIDGDASATASSIKKRTTKPKSKLAAPRKIKPRHKENLPWIKW